MHPNAMSCAIWSSRLCAATDCLMLQCVCDSPSSPIWATIWIQEASVVSSTRAQSAPYQGHYRLFPRVSCPSTCILLWWPRRGQACSRRYACMAIISAMTHVQR